MPFFSSIFKGKDAAAKKREPNGTAPAVPAKPKWEDAWLRKEVDAEEVQELLRCCTYEIKSRGKFGGSLLTVWEVDRGGLRL